jgi:pyridoxal biosynthesis lyase PdxS
VKNSHDAENIMTGPAFDLEIIIPADILKKGRVRRSADGRQVDLHLDAADIPELTGVDEPFGALAIAF